MTRQQYELNCEILQSLDKIDNCVMESETLVMDSIMDAYSKAVTVLEHCSDTADLSSFNIIQEEFREDHRRPPNKNNLIMKILLFIPRMIKKFIDFLLSKTGIGNDMKKLIARIDELEKMSKSDKEKIIQLIKDNEEKIKDGKRDHRELHDDFYRHSNIVDEKIKDVSRNQRDLRDDFNRHSNRNEKRFNDIEEVINVMNGNIMTNLDFDKIRMIYIDIVKMFEVLEKYDIHKPSTLSKDIRQQISLGKTVVDTSFDIRTTSGFPKSMRLSDLRQYMHDISVRRSKITQLGQRVCDKLNEQAKVFEGTELNENQQKKLDDFTMVSKYITQYISVAKELESKIGDETNSIIRHFDAIKRLRNPAESK